MNLEQLELEVITSKPIFTTACLLSHGELLHCNFCNMSQNVLRLGQRLDSYFPSALVALAESTTSITLTKERHAGVLAELER